MKRALFMGAMLIAVGAMCSSCIKDTIENGCSCTRKDTKTNESTSHIFSRDKVKAEDIYSCSAYAKLLETTEPYYIDWTCWGRYTK